MRKIVEYRRYDPIPEPPKPIVVAVDETGDLFNIDGSPWFPPTDTKLRLYGILSAEEWKRQRSQS